jgi:hypothetical protein
MTYTEKKVADWTVNDIIAYTAARHAEVYGVEYRPFRSWQAERGLIGGLVGTKGRNAKPRKYEPEIVKAFIDECFKIHKGTREYPGVSFTWLWTYKTAVWQRVQADSQRNAEREARRNHQPQQPIEDITEWL